MDEKKKLEKVHVTISGRVQGVAFRYSAVDCARSLGITGWVKNLPDGRVETVAEGERADLEEYVKWCRRGPPAAHVTGFVARWGEAAGAFSKFAVR